MVISIFCFLVLRRAFNHNINGAVEFRTGVRRNFKWLSRCYDIAMLHFRLFSPWRCRVGWRGGRQNLADDGAISRDQGGKSGV
jgi:hypothetical protein